MLLVGVGVGVGHHHCDHDFAARVTGTSDVELLAVDDPLVAIEYRPGGDVSSIRRSHIGFGHGITRANLAVEKGFEPLRFLLGRSHPFQHFHVAGVGGVAVQNLGSDRVFAQFSRNVCVVEVGQPFTVFAVWQEEVPQAAFFSFAFEAFKNGELFGRVRPVIGPHLAELEEPFAFRIDALGHERFDLLQQRLCRLRHLEVVHLGGSGQASGHCLLQLGNFRFKIGFGHLRGFRVSAAHSHLSSGAQGTPKAAPYPVQSQAHSDP